MIVITREMKKEATKEKQRKRQKVWRDSLSPKEKRFLWRKDHLRAYGLTPERLTIEIEKRSGQCDICNRKPTRNHQNGKSGNPGGLQVDHKAGTKGSFRGLLCVNCNMGIAAFHEDPILFERAVRYLRQ